MSHEHFHCFVDMLLARPVHLDETGSVIEGSVAEVRRLQDVNAIMLKALYNAEVMLEFHDDKCNALKLVRAAIAKAEKKS